MLLPPCLSHFCLIFLMMFRIKQKCHSFNHLSISLQGSAVSFLALFLSNASFAVTRPVSPAAQSSLHLKLRWIFYKHISSVVIENFSSNSVWTLGLPELLLSVSTKIEHFCMIKETTRFLTFSVTETNTFQILCLSLH